MRECLKQCHEKDVRRLTAYRLRYGCGPITDYVGPDGGMYFSDIISADSAYDDEAALVEVPNAAWGDYVGSVYDRASHGAWIEDWGQYSVALTDSYGTQVVAVPLDVPMPVDAAEAIAEALIAALDYPYSDEAWDIEQDIEREDWDNWGAHDFRVMLRRALTGDAFTDTVVNGVDLVPDDDDALRRIYDDACNMTDTWPWQVETAVSGYWDDSTENVAEYAATRIINAYVTTDPMPGEEPLPTL